MVSEGFSKQITAKFVTNLKFHSNKIGARIKDLNLGISITLDNLGSLSLLDAIDRVTSDLEMRKRMKKASKIDEQNNGLCKFVDEMNYYLTKQKV